MKLLVLSDIFGKAYLSQEILSLPSNLIVLDPYGNETFYFSDEDEAYKTYMEKCGHERYFQKALEVCQKENIEMIVGFSVGGSIAWRLSSFDFKFLNKVVCFYPSQVRNHLELEPKVTTNIIFAKYESSFDTNEIFKIVSKKEKVKSEISLYNHGFMNQKSKNYDKTAFEKYLKKIQNAL